MRRSDPRFLFAAGVVASLAAGQIRLNQDGRLFDANPQLGSGGYNAPIARPVSPLLSGNLLASGNARFGSSLRISSPIVAPTAFRASLGSSRLSGFLRDSFSVADAPRSRLGLSAAPFFDPTTNVFTSGPLSTGPPRTMLGPLAQRPGLPGLLNYGTPLRTRVRPEPLARAEKPGQPVGAPLRSSLFGVRPRVPEPLSLEPQRPKSLPTLEQFTRDSATVESRPPRLRAGLVPLGPDLRPQQAETTGESEATAALGTPSLTNPLLLGPGQATGQTLRLPEPSAVAAGPQARAGERMPVSARLIESMLPGQDVFTDLRLAATLAEDPRADWFDELKRLARQAGSAERMQQLEQLDAQQYVQRVLSEPIRTFAGKAPTAINDLLLKAEGLMAVGQYYDAARNYERAAALDPTNPLPWIGRAHALLAAGEYLSAAVSLTRGLKRFPDLARFHLDLKALMGGGEVVDIRRAEIMRLLKRREDYRLRFLLGYLEYHSGNRKLGLENLRQAADEAPIGSIIRRYPNMIQGKSLPPPELDLPAFSPTPGPSGETRP